MLEIKLSQGPRYEFGPPLADMIGPMFLAGGAVIAKAAIATNVSSAESADRSSVSWWRGLDPPKGSVYSAISWKMKSVEPAGEAGSRSMPKSRGRKPKKPRAPTKGAPKQLIAHNIPPREPLIPAQTVQQVPSIPPQTVQQESSIPRQTLLQSILKWTMRSVKRAWVLLVTATRSIHRLRDRGGR